MTIIVYKYMNAVVGGNIKVDKNDFYILNFNDFGKLTKYNYNINQLKQMCKHHKLKVGGNKKEIFSRVYLFLYESHYSSKIQSLYRGYLQRKMNKLKGVSLFKRNLSTNQDDFYTLDNLSTIHPDNYFSYNINTHNYGFSVTSIYNLIQKSASPTNPYNRIKLTNKTIRDVHEIIRLSTIFKKKLFLGIKINSNNKFKILDIFSKIEEFGYSADFNWFYMLEKIELLKLFRELFDIWNYRAQLSIESKKNICYPTGNPFLNYTYANIYHLNVHNLQKCFITIFYNLLTKARDRTNQGLGALYILGAITIVNQNASNSLPWLYDSFGIINN
jgi:hypothetical protein